MEETEEKKKPRRRRRWLKVIAVAVAAFAVLLVVLALLTPFILTHIPYPSLEFDLAPQLGEKAASLVSNKTVTAKFDVQRIKPEGFRVRAEGRLLDWPYTLAANVHFGFVRAKGDLSLSLDGTPWRLDADFDARGTKDWLFRASVPETAFDQEDRLLAPVLAKLDLPAVSNLVFSGMFSFEAEGSSTPKVPVPTWSAKGSLRDVGASLDVGGKAARVDGLRTKFGASGIAGHVDVAPIQPRASALEYAGFAVSNFYASVRATERGYLVTEARAAAGGGNLRLYTLFLDPESLSAGATILVDDVDAGAVLAHVSGFRGTASGRLHGKLPFSLRNGRTLRFRKAHLFSTPGETGTVRVTDASPIIDNLALGGVDKPTLDNLEKALRNLDYTVLKVELVPGEPGEDSALALKLEGTATEGKTTVPVNINVTFRGDLDRLIDTGMKLSTRR